MAACASLRTQTFCPIHSDHRKFSSPGNRPGMNVMHLFSVSARPGAANPMASAFLPDFFDRSRIMSATARFHCFSFCSLVSCFTSFKMVPSLSMRTPFMFVPPKSIPMANGFIHSKLILSVTDAPAAIHSKHLAGCESGSIRHKVDRSIVQVTGPADTTSVQRLFRSNEVHYAFILSGPLSHGRLHQARCQDIDPYIIFCIIRSNRFRKADHCRFSGGISMGVKIIWRRRAAQHRPHVQNTARSFLFEKSFYRSLIGKHE